MVILNKIKASTLMETLVATVLIVIVFVMASMTLNNFFTNTIKHNTRAIEAYMNELQYLQQCNKLQIPYTDSYKEWNITVDRYTENSRTYIAFEAVNKATKKTLILTQYDIK